VSRASTAVFDPWRTAWAYADAAATTRATAATWRGHRELRLRQLLVAAARGSALYRERLAAAGEQGSASEVLQRMRPVQKRELMHRFADWVTDPALTLSDLRDFVHDRANRGRAFRDRYLVWESSGSSGEPALFVQDDRALAVADALEAARGPVALDSASPWAAWLAGAPRAERIALVAATEGQFATVVSFERARGLNPWLAATSHGFSFLQPLEQLAEQLDAFAPSVLATYPSMAWVLSEAQRHGRLHIAPHAVWTGGETLTPALRRAIGEGFGGTDVRDSYGASECFLIANECRGGRLHLNADWVILEPVDDRARPVTDGRFGATTLLTNLANEVQPIIRYDLGDRVRIVPGACACGSSLPAIEVQGRAGDVFTLHDARGHAVHLSPLALTTVLEDEAGLFDFQLRQSSPRRLELDLYGRGNGDVEARDAAVRAGTVLRRFLGQRGLGTTRVQCHSRRQAATRGRSGKQERVVCALPA
jgi:phenylacetate-CoA ligase